MKHHISFDLEFRTNPYPGKLIVIEGVDGSGKTTQAKEVVKRLNKEGYNAAYTKEPTDDIIGAFIRQDFLSGKRPLHPLAFQYLMNADRVMHMEKMEGFLKKGMIIIMDRYFWSSVAYAMSDIEAPKDWYLTAFSILSFYHQFIIPDYSFFLKVSPATALSRIDQSGKHNEIYDTAEKLPKIEKGYEMLREKFPEVFTLIDGDRQQEVITEDILRHIKYNLPKGA